MAHFNEIVVKTAKNRKNTQKVVKASLAQHYPDFALQDLYAEDGEWKATLLKELTASEVAKLAGLPFEEGEEEVSEAPEEPKEEKPKGKAPKKDKKSDGEKSDGESDGAEGLEEAGEELARIEDILQELNDRVRQLQDKANVVDEIHESTKPHVEKLDKLEEEGLGEEVPMAPPGPPSPGGAPGGPGGSVGPSAPPKLPFAASTKIAYASIKQDGIEFSMPEVVEAMQQHFAKYEVVDIKKDVAKNKYIAKLELKR